MMPWVRIASSLFILLLVAITGCGRHAPVPKEKSVTIGWAVKMQGDWSVAGQPIKGGQPLSLGPKIQCTSNQPGDELRVCFRNGKVKILTPDDTSLKEDGNDETNSYTERLVAAIFQRYHGDLVHAVSRGGMIDDGLAQIQNDLVSLEPLLTLANEGSYRLQWTRISPDGSPALESRPIRNTFEWNPVSPMPIAMNGLSPGLWRIEILDADDQPQPNEESLVLLAEANDFKEKSKDYAQALELTKSWDDDSKQTLAAGFLRACLISLAGEATPRLQAASSGESKKDGRN